MKNEGIVAVSSLKNLLVELLVEELPPKALKRLGDGFAESIAEGLRAQGLAAGDGGVIAFASPRRLGALVSQVLDRADDRRVQHKLMPVTVGLDAQGRATPALRKKLASLGVDPDAMPLLERRTEGNVEMLYLDSQVPGVKLADGLQIALDNALSNLPIPKVMSYQLHSGGGPGFKPGWTTVHFVRPAHALVAMHGGQVVHVRALGLEAGRETFGHRFEAKNRSVVLRSADHYAAQLANEGAVIPSFEARRHEIERQIAEAAGREGLEPIRDDDLLDEVTALVERPNVLVCQFDREFLDVPQECLILTMKANQKYFPLLDAAGKLTNKFLVVSNIRPSDPRAIIAGNERVVRPRLADAKFFFEQDSKRTLESRLPGLDKVVYHGKLGTQGQRIERLRVLAREIASELGDESIVEQADRAACLAKADLLTDMVGEFPELQGVMGCYYARRDGESDEVALAIEDHYKPRFAGDGLPRGTVGLAVALADKLETLAGLFGIGQAPSGDKDPFALRRHGLGVIRMLIERELPLDPHQLVSQAFAAFPPEHGQAQAEVGYFLRERLVGYLREGGYTAQEVEAVLEVPSQTWAELPKRLAAVRAFSTLPEAAALAAANKRIGNILKKSDSPVAGTIDLSLLREPAEQELQKAIEQIGPKASTLFERGEYADSLRLLAALREPVDAFFDGVMVNAEDAALRANRLGLLTSLHAAMNRVADLSKLAA
jgi:glycyl-tRNA synthetase beta chain